MRRLVTGMATMIRVDQVWLARRPLDMRAGIDTLLGRVVETFGEARLHQAYLFANRPATRMKVLVHDGIGIWLAARRLHQGRFIWPQGDATATLTRQQFDALVLGLLWERLGDGGIIRVL